MDENVSRRITLILGLLAVALFSAFFLRPRLGLDLSGGTRVVLRVPFEEAVQNNMLDARELNNKRAVIEQMIEIYGKRIDPTGVREPQIRPEGEDRIVIELPSLAGNTAELASGRLGADIGTTDRTLVLETDDDVSLRSFPPGGGTIEIDGELIFYEQRDGNQLLGLTRGALDAAKAHGAQTEVRLKETDDLIQLLTSTGELHFFIAAKTSDFNRAGTDQASELQKVQAWMQANPEAENLEAFNAMLPPEGPPRNPTIRWYTSVDEREAETPFAERTPQAVVEQEDPAWRFSGGDLVSEGVQPTQDRMGGLAVAFKIVDTKANAFGDFTQEHKNEPMAIVINGEIETMPTIEGRLQGSGIIKGGGLVGFAEDEVNNLVTVLRSGSLRIRPTIESQERVGATLGEESIRRGTISGILGLLATLIFMIYYYRRLGLVATLSLVANVILLVGVLSFLKATLTLPGIAGIILTIGMAVDANILIYERIREEALRGRKPIQAAKDGFANALSTIVDSNLTTLITGFVLYLLGSGPVRGFATTLCLGILTSMFSALVITRVLVHLQLERGDVKEWTMKRWVSATKIRFIKQSKRTLPISLGLILLGLGVYFMTPKHDKFGIDFLGGVTMTVRTEQPQQTSDVRTKVRAIEGTIGETSEVKAILSSGSKTDGYNQFRITFKADQVAQSGSEDSDRLTDLFRGEVRSALGDILERGPYEVEVTDGQAEGRLYFRDPHPITDLTAALAEIPIEDVAVEKIEGPIAGYSFQGGVSPDKTKLVLGPLIQNRFENKADSSDLPYQWAEPIPDYSTVGAAVVSELRDKAFLAILVSLFFVVMYIRIRFAEYSYSFAAVAALVHDVLIALGVLSLVIRLDNIGFTIVDAQINLPMIAAFLTIIGYSLNDTIVVFDRIRENLPRMKGSLEEIVDTSINQTLSRTLLTSGTTLTTLLILLSFNIGSRNVLEGFSFTLAIGILVGTYSSMYVASPVLVFLEKRRLASLEASGEDSAKVKKKSAEVVKS